MRIYLPLVIAILSVSFASGSECPSDRILNGQCLKTDSPEVSCKADFATPALQRACLAIIKSEGSGNLYNDVLDGWASQPTRVSGDQKMYADELADSFPGGRKQIDDAVKSCRTVIATYRKTGAVVSEGEVVKRYTSVRQAILFIEKAATHAYDSCPAHQTRVNPFAHEHESFSSIEDFHANSVERYFDATLYRQGLIDGQGVDDPHFGEKESSSPDCRSALIALGQATRGIRSKASVAASYALAGSNTDGRILNATQTQFVGVPVDKQNELGLAFFQTYTDCVDLVDKYAVAGYDPARKPTQEFHSHNPKVESNRSQKSYSPCVEHCTADGALEAPSKSGPAF